ncbi:hypothetical protein B0O99DRAFT_690803 [Bisporella sp. PMI_857]|nr:hypothetical protein B0O99DRAFT_690803 [Bisporella sp. PMI_857]
MSSLRAMRDAENSRRRAQIRAEDDAESSSKVRENIRPRRHCVLQPSIVPLTEETLLQLEQSHPRYRLTQRNLNHWFYYLESTLQDTFNTFAGIPDKTYKPGSSAATSLLQVLRIFSVSRSVSHSQRSKRSYPTLEHPPIGLLPHLHQILHPLPCGILCLQQRNRPLNQPQSNLRRLKKPRQ